MTRRLRLATAVMLVMGIGGLLPRLASAQPAGHPFITEVHADFDLFRLRIVGDQFGTTPAVWLGERLLAIESATNTEILALLGGPIEPGSYLITVANDAKKKGTAKYLHSAFNATIGAAGPKGDKGDQGLQGVPGNDGRDGVDGTNGADGASPFALVGNNAVYTQGNVGVGTTAPTALFQAGDPQGHPNHFGNITTLGVWQRQSDTVALSLRSALQNPVFQFCSAGNCNYVEMERDTFSLALGTNGQGGRLGPSPSTMIVQRHDLGGNVGVGTRAPTAKLHVGNLAGFPNHFGNITTLGVFQEPGDTVGLSIRRGGGNPIQQFCDFADCNYIEMQAGSHDLLFGTNGNSSNPTMTVRRTIQGGGVGIHQPPVSGVALAVNGQVVATAPVFAPQFIQTSSRRFKTDIETVTGAVDLVGRMRGVTYTSRATGKAEVGVIAEEMYDVLPQVVAVADGQVQGVEYSRLVAVLIEAVKEQQAQIQSLRRELTSLATALAGAQK